MENTSSAYAKGRAQGEKCHEFVASCGPTLWDASIVLNAAVGATLVATGVVFASKALAVSGVVSLASAAVMEGCKRVYRGRR